MYLFHAAKLQKSFGLCKFIAIPMLANLNCSGSQMDEIVYTHIRGN